MTRSIPPYKIAELNRKSEMVNHPSHYQSNGKECIDLMIDIFGIEKVMIWCELTAFKYQFRKGKKSISPKEEDEAKEKWYNNKEQELMTLNFYEMCND